MNFRGLLRKINNSLRPVHVQGEESTDQMRNHTLDHADAVERSMSGSDVAASQEKGDG